MSAVMEAPPFEIVDGDDVPHDEGDRPCHLPDEGRGGRGFGLCGAVIPEPEWRPPHWPCGQLCPRCVEIAGPERLAEIDATIRAFIGRDRG